MAVALIFVLVAVGSVVFHFLSPWWWTPIASNWQYIDHTIIITFWITGVVFIAVVWFHGLLRLPLPSRAGTQGRLRAGEQDGWNRGSRSAPAVGVAAMLAPGLFVWHQFVTVPQGRDRDRGGRPAVAVELSPAGQGRKARQLGRAQYQLGSIRSALDPNDPERQDDVVIESDDLHLPIGKPVKVLLRSIDVLHDFYVPEFRAKMDMIPGIGDLLLVHADA